MKKNKYYLIVLPDGQIGGAERILMSVAKNLISENHQVDVLLLNSQGCENWIPEIPDKNLIINHKNSYLQQLKFLYVYLSKRNFTFTFSSNIHVNSILGFLRRFNVLNTKFLVVRESTSIFRRFKGLALLRYKTKYLMGYSQTDLVICQTEFMKLQLLNNWRLSQSWNIAVIPNPVDISNVINLANETRPNLYGKYILAIGRLVEEKGFDLLIKAFSNIKDTKLKLIIVGKGKEYKNLSKLTKLLKIEERVHFTGFIANPMPYIKYANVCVVSSRVEGFPNVLLQMMALNSNVVSTLCAGGIEGIPNLITTKPENEESLQHAIDMALSLTPYQLLSNKEAYQRFIATRDIRIFMSKIKLSLKKVSKV